MTPSQPAALNSQPPTGYKQTQVGVIPEDWEVKTIDQVGFVTSGKRLPLGAALVEHPTPHPYVRVTDMRPGTVALSEIKFVPESIFPAIRRYRIFCEDIFISVAGSLGIIGKVPKELDGANLTENANKISKITCSQDFLLHVLMSPLIQNTIDSLQTVGAQPKLALTRIRKFTIPQPPAPEQRAIAKALSDVDGLLGGLDQLIAKKRDLKQAAMQQLLTGKTRLPGFHGAWEVRRLGQDIDLLSGHHVLAQHCNSDGHGVPYITGPADFPEGRIENTKFTERPSTICAPNDILVTVKGSGSGAIVLADSAYCISRQLMAIRVKQGDCKFIYYSLLQNTAVFNAAATGLIPGLSRSDILDRRLPLPPTVREQTAIAEVLTDMDSELAGLDRWREKTRVLKHAMMQELLTGRTRLL